MIAIGRKALPIAFGVLGGAILSAVGLTAIRARTVPVVVQSVREVDGVAVSNGRLELVMTFNRARTCPAITRRWLWRWVEIDGRRMKKFVPLLEQGVPIDQTGETTLVLSLQMPAGVEPGEWTFGSRTEYRCSWLPDFFAGLVRESVPVSVLVMGNR